MDRILESNNIESIKKMILMQEQLFKQQVQELHRLYNIQKKLMHEIDNGLKRRKEITALVERSNSGFAIRHQPAMETGHFFQAFSARDDPKEQSGSNSRDSSRMLIKFDLEMPAESTPSSTHHLEEQKGLKKMDDENDVEVELTLSIGRCTSENRSTIHLYHHCSTQFRELQESEKFNEVQEIGSSSTKTDKGEEYDQPRSIVSSSSVYQDNKRPRWLLQDLSLNRT